MRRLGRRRPAGAPEDSTAPAARRGDGALPLLAAITMTRDSGPMLRRWVDHHAAQVGGFEHLFIVDDHSEDGSTDGLESLGCNVIRLPYLEKYGFEQARMGIVSGLARSLLFAYDAVLFADADEFVVADPKVHASLRHFAAARPGRDAVGVLGYNVIHHLGAEGPLDLSGPPLLRQREFARFTPLMCKPALKWVAADWGHASHGIRVRYALDPELFMFHLKYADADELDVMAQRRHRAAAEEGRAVGSGWSRPASDMTDALVQASEQLREDNIGKFRPGPKKLESIVRKEGDLWRAAGAGQHLALVRPPYVRIPERFRDLL